MEEFMALFWAVLVQEGFHHRVALSALEGGGTVDVIKALGTLFLDRHQAVGLAGAAHAAVGAGHDLYKIIVGFAAVDGLQQRLGIGKAVDHRQPDLLLL